MEKNDLSRLYESKSENGVHVAKELIFAPENEYKIIGVTCSCGDEHPVYKYEHEHVGEIGYVTGFEACSSSWETRTMVSWNKTIK